MKGSSEDVDTLPVTQAVSAGHQCLFMVLGLTLGPRALLLSLLFPKHWRGDGNWSSLVMERVFFPGLSSLLDSAEQISKAVTRSTKAQSWWLGWCHTCSSLTPSSSHSTPAGCQGLSQVLLTMFLEAPEQQGEFAFHWLFSARRRREPRVEESCFHRSPNRQAGKQKFPHKSYR